MKMKQIIVQALLVLFLSSNLVYSKDKYLDGDVKARKERAKELVQIVLNGSNVNEVYFSYWDTVGELFINASKEDLQQYKLHPKLSISLHAAWEQLKRTSFLRVLIFKEKPEEENYDDEFMEEVPAIEMGRFIGFLEGRIPVPLPKWWRDFVQAKYLYQEKPKNEYYDPEFDSIIDTPYTKHDIGGKFKKKVQKLNKKFMGERHLYVLDSLNVVFMPEMGWQVPYDGFQIKSGRNTCIISEKYFLEFLDEDVDTSFICFTAWMNEEYCVFAFHLPFPNGMTLRCINRKNLNLIWSKECTGYLSIALGGGDFISSFFEIQGNKDLVYLFGSSSGAEYLEVFSLKDGKRLEQFGTEFSYEDDDEESEDQSGNRNE